MNQRLYRLSERRRAIASDVRIIGRTQAERQSLVEDVAQRYGISRGAARKTIWDARRERGIKLGKRT